jgi:hypothetical protein
MTNDENPKRYDLEDRTFAFAKDVRAFVKNVEKTIANIEDVKQLVRASGLSEPIISKLTRRWERRISS